MGNDREYFGASFLEHVADTLDGEETVGIVLLTDSFEEDGKVMMVVELGHINLPVDLILGSVLNSDGQISTVVESTEFTCGDDAIFLCSSSWGSRLDFGDGSHFARVVTSGSHSFLSGGF